MGSYAYSIQFSDGHNTGLYTLEFLREVGGRGVIKPLDLTQFRHVVVSIENVWFALVRT